MLVSSPEDNPREEIRKIFELCHKTAQAHIYFADEIRYGRYERCTGLFGNACQ